MHVEISKEVVALSCLHVSDAGASADVSICDVAGLKSGPMKGRRPGWLRKINADSDIGKTRNLKLDSVADGFRARLNRDGGKTAELDLLVGAGSY